MTDVLAAHFLAGSLLTLLLPVGLVVIVTVYGSLLARQKSRRKTE